MPEAFEEEQTPLVRLLEQDSARIILLKGNRCGDKRRDQYSQGGKKRSSFKPNGMDDSTDKKTSSDSKGKNNKQAGSNKKIQEYATDYSRGCHYCTQY